MTPTHRPAKCGNCMEQLPITGDSEADYQTMMTHAAVCPKRAQAGDQRTQWLEEFAEQQQRTGPMPRIPIPAPLPGEYPSVYVDRSQLDAQLLAAAEERNRRPLQTRVDWPQPGDTWATRLGLWFRRKAIERGWIKPESGFDTRPLGRERDYYCLRCGRSHYYADEICGDGHPPIKA